MRHQVQLVMCPMKGDPIMTNHQPRMIDNILYAYDSVRQSYGVIGRSSAPIMPPVIRIKASIDNIPVTFIDNAVFSNISTLKQVEIPVSVAELSDDCFAQCENLESVVFTKNDEPEYPLTVAQQTIAIHDATFFECENLRLVSSPVLLRLHSNVFYKCHSLEEIDAKILISTQDPNSALFFECFNLKYLLIDNTNALQITPSMFAGCTQPIDLVFFHSMSVPIIPPRYISHMKFYFSSQDKHSELAYHGYNVCLIENSPYQNR